MLNNLVVLEKKYFGVTGVVVVPLLESRHVYPIHTPPKVPPATSARCGCFAPETP